MRWRKTAAIGGAALGAAALYNTAAARELMDDDVLGGEPDEFRWRGHRIAITRHGEGKPVLLLHGIYPGASSLEWRHVVPALAQRYAVVAVDLLGFGHSDRPAARYTPGLYQALFGDLLARVVREPCAVVASGLSAAQLVALAGRDPRHIASMTLVAPTGVAYMRDARGMSDPFDRARLAFASREARVQHGIRRITRHQMQDVRQDQLLMLFLVIQPKLDQRRQ